MKAAYKVLAYLVAAEVAIQAMAVVWAIAGLGKWVDGGGVLDKAVMESEASPFPEVFGFIVHGINGTFVIPGIALLLLIISFFTKVRGAIKWAVIVFVLVVVQGQLGFLGHESCRGRCAARSHRAGAVRHGSLRRAADAPCATKQCFTFRGAGDGAGLTGVRGVLTREI